MHNINQSIMAEDFKLISNGEICFESELSTEDAQQDFDGHILAAVGGFFAKYFPELQSAADVDQHFAALWTLFELDKKEDSLLLEPPSARNLLHWFAAFSLHSKSDRSSNVWRMCFPDPRNNENDAICFINHLQADQNWLQIKAIGRICQESSPTSYTDGLLSLFGLSRKVFAAQPTRLFLHGFYVHESLLELWVFDRSGAYSSETLNHQTDFKKFVCILLGYQLMSDEQLGLNEILTRQDPHSCVLLSGANKVFLEQKPFVASEDVVGNGTTCFRAKSQESESWDRIVKFKWRLGWRDRPEEDMLKLVNERQVWGAISLFDSQQVATTVQLREGLRLNGRTRKLVLNNANLPISNDEKNRGVIDYSEETDMSWETRICSLLVLSPLGRPLRSFKTTLELLQVFHDAIKSHRSLLQDANVLHQDISPGNIIIVDNQDKQQPKGILIDFDVAMDLAVGPRSPGEVTGTRPFMAIEILLGKRHWYRHDLESFVYVFLWTLITEGRESPPHGSILKKWSRGDWDDLAAEKSRQMTEEGFRSLLEEFPSRFESFKPLAEKLRAVLFPIVNGEIWIGSNNEPGAIDNLYDNVVEVFQNAIAAEAAATGGLNLQA